MKNIVILGAGISGLSLAWFLKKQYGSSISITLLEKSDRIGGWIQTNEEDGFLFELGPHSCRPHGNGMATLDLIEQLGLQEQVITPDPSATLRYLYVDGKLNAVPHNISSFISSPLTKGAFAALWRDWTAASSDAEDESIATFGERRFGKEITHRLIDPLITGIYAGDIAQLSVKSCFPTWKESEQKYGSVISSFFRKRSAESAEKTPWSRKISTFPFFSLKNGLSTLSKELESHLQESIVKKCKVYAIELASDGVVLKAEDGKVWKADHLFCAIPPAALAALLVPHRPALSILLQSITTASVAVASVGYRKKVLKQDGFGYLIPSQEQEKVLGMIWDSSIFPQQNRHNEETRLTVMMGGAHHPQMCEWSDDRLRAVTLEALSRHLQIDTEPDVMRITHARNAIPQYKVGHERLLKRIDAGLKDLSPHITLLGSFCRGASVNDCIALAQSKSNLHN